MKLARFLTPFYLLILSVAVSLAAPPAQPNDAQKLYTQGVDAFFAGRYTAADSLLSKSIALNAGDPRLFYFRGLSRHRQGFVRDAEIDFEIAADLEATKPGSVTNQDLKRLDGSARQLIERFRSQARVPGTSGAYNEAATWQIIYDGRDESVLRKRIAVPLDELLREGGPRPIRVSNSPVRPQAGLPVSDPFRDDAAAEERATSAPAPKSKSGVTPVSPQAASPAAGLQPPLNNPEPIPPSTSTPSTEKTDASSPASQDAEEDVFQGL